MAAGRASRCQLRGSQRPRLIAVDGVASHSSFWSQPRGAELIEACLASQMSHQSTEQSTARTLHLNHVPLPADTDSIEHATLKCSVQTSILILGLLLMSIVMLSYYVVLVLSSLLNLISVCGRGTNPCLKQLQHNCLL